MNLRLKAIFAPDITAAYIWIWAYRGQILEFFSKESINPQIKPGNSMKSAENQTKIALKAD